MNDNFQLPLELDPKGKSIRICADDMVPNKYIVAPPPDRGLVLSIAEKGVLQSFVVCFHPKTGLYYPLAGRRRLLALRKLAEMEHKYHGRYINKVKWPALLREDLKPTDVNAHEIAFAENNTRSANILTDMEAIRSAAEDMKSDIHNDDFQKAVARKFKTSVGTIRKLVKVMSLPDAVYVAFAEGMITERGMELLAALPNKQQKPIIKKLEDGEGVSTTEIQQASHKAVEKAVNDAGQPEILIDYEQLVADSPVMKALRLLDKTYVVENKAVQVPIDVFDEIRELLKQVI